MLHGDHVGKLARRPIDPIKEKNIRDEPRLNVLTELFNCGGGVCGEGAVGVLWRCLQRCLQRCL